jgi:hypothetical protein
MPTQNSKKKGTTMLGLGALKPLPKSMEFQKFWTPNTDLLPMKIRLLLRINKPSFGLC